MRAPLSLQRIRWDEQQDTVTWSAAPSEFFKDRIHLYSSLDFIAQVTLHVPPPGRHLVRRYGLYCSRGGGTWTYHLALLSLAPTNRYGRNASADPALPDAPKDREIDAFSRRKAWARLKVHELDVMACPRCASRMSVISHLAEFGTHGCSMSGHRNVGRRTVTEGASQEDGRDVDRDAYTPDVWRITCMRN